MAARKSRMLRFFCCGALAGVVLWGAAWVLAAGAGVHGSQLPFTIVFPWSHLLYRVALFGDQTWALSVVTFLELPLYGLALGAFWGVRRRILLLAALLALHLIAVGACFLPQPFYESFW